MSEQQLNDEREFENINEWIRVNVAVITAARVWYRQIYLNNGDLTLDVLSAADNLAAAVVEYEKNNA